MTQQRFGVAIERAVLRSCEAVSSRLCRWLMTWDKKIHIWNIKVLHSSPG